MKEIHTDIVKEYLKKGGNVIPNIARKVYEDRADQVFSEAIEVGITNTIAALYDAGVNDDEIVRVINKFWGIHSEEVEERIIFEKQYAAKRELKHYLKMEGYTETEIQQFMISTKAYIKIKHDKELWKLAKSPEKLFKAVKEGTKRG